MEEARGKEITFLTFLAWKVGYLREVCLEFLGAKKMSENWIRESRRLIEHIRKLQDSSGKDRLDMVKSLRFILMAINRSVSGWLWWVNNPDTMIKFSLEELKEMNKKLSEFALSFIEYDIEVTESGAQKGATPRRATRRERNEHYLI